MNIGLFPAAILLLLGLLRAAPVPAADTSLSVLSFNTWGAGANQGQSLAATEAVLRAADADLVGLQEVRAEADSCSGSDCPAKGVAASIELARRLGYHHYQQRASNDALWANAILSRYPIIAVSKHDLGIKLAVAGREVVLFNIHATDYPYQPYQLLGIPYDDAPFLHTADQAVHAARLARNSALQLLLAELDFANTAELVLLTGDFNEPSHRDWSTRAARTEQALINAARGMLTTDTVHKIRSQAIELTCGPVQITGIAKGAAMIGPNMATMLAVIMTDAPLSIAAAQAGLKDAVDESFNCISVDGHTSTSDTVLLLANGAAGGPELADADLAKFQATLVEVCEDLAQSIPADGEGASHLITVEVHGCQNRQDAVTIAKTIADSPLVKTAIAGADPNWGRIVSAAGYAGISFDPTKVSLLINGMLLYEHGAPVEFDAAAVSESIRASRDTGILLLLDEGSASARFWTTDLTAEYVRLNADYHT